MQFLCQAFDADPAQPAVLITLARLCINRGDAERARALAEAAHSVAAVPEARAHALVLQGRAYHALSNFKEAYACYQKVQYEAFRGNRFRLKPEAMPFRQDIRGMSQWNCCHVHLPAAGMHVTDAWAC